MEYILGVIILVVLVLQEMRHYKLSKKEKTLAITNSKVTDSLKELHA